MALSSPPPPSMASTGPKNRAARANPATVPMTGSQASSRSCCSTRHDDLARLHAFLMRSNMWQRLGDPASRPRTRSGGRPARATPVSAVFVVSGRRPPTSLQLDLGTGGLEGLLGLLGIFLRGLLEHGAR